MHGLVDYVFTKLVDVLYNLSSYAQVFYIYTKYDQKIVWRPLKAQLPGYCKNYIMEFLSSYL